MTRAFPPMSQQLGGAPLPCTGLLFTLRGRFRPGADA